MATTPGAERGKGDHSVRQPAGGGWGRGGGGGGCGKKKRKTDERLCLFGKT